MLTFSKLILIIGELCFRFEVKFLNFCIFRRTSSLPSFFGTVPVTTAPPPQQQQQQQQPQHSEIDLNPIETRQDQNNSQEMKIEDIFSSLNSVMNMKPPPAYSEATKSNKSNQVNIYY